MSMFNRIFIVVSIIAGFSYPAMADGISNGGASSITSGATPITCTSGTQGILFQSGGTVTCNSNLTTNGSGQTISAGNLQTLGNLWMQINTTSTVGALYWGVSSDAVMSRDAAGIIGLTQSVTTVGSVTLPATFRVYNVASGSLANYERGVMDWTTTSNVFILGTQKAGTGTSRDVSFVTGGTEFLRGNATTNNPKFRTSSTGAGVQTFTNSPCTTLNTEQYIPVEITGQSGTWFIAACQ